MPGTVSEEVRAQRDHHDRRVAGRVEQRIDEACPLCLVRAEREDLLELIHDDESARVIGRQLGNHVEGARTGSDQVTSRCGGTVRPGQGGNQASPQQRRLSAAGRADNGQEVAAGQPGGQLCDESLTSEEPHGVRRLKARQAEVRGLLSRRRAPASSGHIRRDVLPPALPLPPITAACLHVGQHHRQRRKSTPSRRIRQRGGRVPRRLRQRPVAGIPGPASQLPQLRGQPFHRSRLRIYRPFGPRHMTPPSCDPPGTVPSPVQSVRSTAPGTW